MAIDADRNGAIDKQEMRDVLEQWIPSLDDQKMDDLWEKLDADCNGALSYKEFADALEPACKHLQMAPKHRPEDARPDGLDPFLVAGDPGAAGLLPGISQSLVTGTLNRLRTDPKLAAAAHRDGLIRAVPDRALFNCAKLAAPPCTAAGLFTPRPFLEPSTIDRVRARKANQGAIGYLTQRGERGCVPSFRNGVLPPRETPLHQAPAHTPRSMTNSARSIPQTARSGRSVLNMGPARGSYL